MQLQLTTMREAYSSSMSFSRCRGSTRGTRWKGAIRSVAQSAKALSFVFLGSERTLLAQIFEDRERPLYMLCDHLEIGRIDAAAYRTFLNEAARLQWNAPMPEQAVESLLSCTERHPFYVNALARALFDQKAVPTLPAVENAWTRLMAQESERFKAQLLPCLISRARYSRRLPSSLLRHLPRRSS
jgi:hypothetical protein